MKLFQLSQGVMLGWLDSKMGITFINDLWSEDQRVSARIQNFAQEIPALTPAAAKRFLINLASDPHVTSHRFCIDTAAIPTLIAIACCCAESGEPNNRQLAAYFQLVAELGQPPLLMANEKILKDYVNWTVSAPVFEMLQFLERNANHSTGQGRNSYIQGALLRLAKLSQPYGLSNVFKTDPVAEIVSCDLKGAFSDYKPLHQKILIDFRQPQKNILARFVQEFCRHVYFKQDPAAAQRQFNNYKIHSKKYPDYQAAFYLANPMQRDAFFFSKTLEFYLGENNPAYWSCYRKQNAGAAVSREIFVRPQLSMQDLSEVLPYHYGAEAKLPQLPDQLRGLETVQTGLGTLQSGQSLP